MSAPGTQMGQGSQLTVTIGQCSDRGRKAENQDFHGCLAPDEPQRSAKGICLALADGISSSQVSRAAAESAVKTFLEDYYCTSEAWSVRTSAERVLGATNSWLYSQTRDSGFRHDRDKGYVCTFSALIFKSATAHVIHAGDARIYACNAGRLEQLTEDHRLKLAEGTTYLSRALGVEPQLEVDYRAVPVSVGSTFLLLTDGVHEHLAESRIAELLEQHSADLDAAARAIVRAALDAGSDDNLTVQVARVECVPERATASEVFHGLSELPVAPLLEPGASFDGYDVVRKLHASHRSHVYLAVDQQSKEAVALKVPSVDVREDPAALERFLMEEWIARRIHNPHVLAPHRQVRRRQFAYLATEFLDGQDLAQWMRDHPHPDIETVRGIMEQIARGLQAFHRQDMLHQDLRPENVFIERSGTVKLIDFGSVRVAGIAEVAARLSQPELLGTAQYAAPEYFLGEAGSRASDIFSLGVLAYQMLSGRLPYGDQVPQARTRQAQSRLVYRSVLAEDREIPAWIDHTLGRALHPNPGRRYAEVSEFIYDLRYPSRAFLARSRPPLLERNPAAFWKGVSLVLAALLAILLARQLQVPARDCPEPVSGSLLPQ